ncbi:MAG: hypothetical protein AB7I68_03955 [Porticoccaceae bacterium]
MTAVIGYDRDGRAIRPGDLCLVVPSRIERQPPPEWLGVLGVAIAYERPGRTVGPRVWLRSPLFVMTEGEVVVWCSALQRIAGGASARAAGGVSRNTLLPGNTGGLRDFTGWTGDAPNRIYRAHFIHACKSRKEAPQAPQAPVL